MSRQIGILCALLATLSGSLGPETPLTANAREISVVAVSPAAADAAKGLVAAGHPVAAAAGAAILARGGNAVDAAVATSAALGVVEPFGSGIGGGGFFLAYRADTGAMLALDCRETAPAAASADMFVDPATGKAIVRDAVITGGRSVGAPGQVRCWDEAMRRWGSLSLHDVLQPRMLTARGGLVTPTPQVCHATDWSVRRLPINAGRCW